VDVVTIDMPVARVAITGRRAADNAISREFWKAWCGTYSPRVDWPGALGAKVTMALEGAGYPVAATDDKAGTRPRFVEV
jgi:hypothetical protein